MSENANPEELFIAFLNEREITGRTALFMAVESNRPKCVETLIQFKADPNIPNNDGITPIQLACEKGLVTAIRVLVKNKARVGVKCDPDLISLIFKSVEDLEERALLMAYLLANGALTSHDELHKLLQTVPEAQRPKFELAIKDAEAARAKNLTSALKDHAPLPTSNDPSKPSPMDIVTAFTGFENPVDDAPTLR